MPSPFSSEEKKKVTVSGTLLTRPLSMLTPETLLVTFWEAVVGIDTAVPFLGK